MATPDRDELMRRLNQRTTALESLRFKALYFLYKTVRHVETRLGRLPEDVVLSPEFTIRMPLDGRRVHEVRVASLGPYVRLVFWGVEVVPAATEYRLEIRGAFSLRIGEKEIMASPDSLPPPPECLHMIEKTVARSVASERGDLRLEFEDGDVLTIPSDKYEPWQICGTDESLIVSIAGGGLSL